MAGRNYRDLIAWQRAMDLVEAVYQVSRLFPREELFGLTSQIRRSAVSIPANIAEGQGRQTERDFLRFLGIAYGSLREVETHVLIAARLAYTSAEECDATLRRTAEVGRLINGLINDLTNRVERHE